MYYAKRLIALGCVSLLGTSSAFGQYGLIDRSTLAPHCVTGKRVTTCTGQLGAMQTQLEEMVDLFLASALSGLSLTEREERINLAVASLEEKRATLAEQALFCPDETEECYVLSPQTFIRYALYTLVQDALEQRVVQTVEETAAYEISRYANIYLLEPKQAIDREFNFFGTTVGQVADDAASCAVINGGYFGVSTIASVTDDTTKQAFLPAGDLAFTDHYQPIPVHILSVNPEFHTDTNLAVPVSYDTSSNKFSLTDSPGTLQFRAGPMLISDGKVNRLLQQQLSHQTRLTTRTFLVVEEDGSYQLGFIPYGSNLFDLARKLSTTPMFSGEYSVVNLDGGSSTAFLSDSLIFREEKKLPRWFSVCDNSSSTTQQETLQDDLEDAIARYFSDIVTDSSSDILLRGFTLGDSTVTSSSASSATVRARLNLFDAIPAQRGCGYATADNRLVLACKQQITLQQSDGNWQVVSRSPVQ